VLSEAPGAIVLDFDEPVEERLSSITVFDADANAVDVGDVEAVTGDASVLTADLPELGDGLYAVVWRITSIDGHVVDGAFSFQIGTSASAASSADLIDQVRAGAVSDPVVGRLSDIARLLAFVGLVLLLGAGAFALMAPASLTTAAATRVVVIGGWAVLMLATAAVFGLHGAEAVAGTVRDAVSPAVWGQVAGTRTGRMLLVRLVLGAVVGALAWRSSARAGLPWRATAVAASIGVIMTFPASGHPSAVEPPGPWVLLDATHLASVVLWLGGLALFTLGGRAWLRDPEAEPVVRRFSSMATWLVPVIVATGTAQTVKLVGGFGRLDSLTESSWGRTLLVKLSVISALVALGAVSRWLLKVSGVPSVRRTVAAEAVLGLVVLGLTASMVSLPPRVVAEAQVFSTTVTQAGVLADLTVTPGCVGSNEMHIVITPAGGSLVPVVGATARMSLPARDIPETPVTLVADGPNHFTGSVSLAFSGDWALDLIVEVSPGSTVLIRTTVPIP
jgi:copper transport protein